MLTPDEVHRIKMKALEEAYAPRFFKVTDSWCYLVATIFMLVITLFLGQGGWTIAVLLPHIFRAIAGLHFASSPWESIPLAEYDHFQVPTEHFEDMTDLTSAGIELYIERDRLRRANIAFLYGINPKTEIPEYLWCWTNPDEDKFADVFEQLKKDLG